MDVITIIDLNPSLDTMIDLYPSLITKSDQSHSSPGAGPMWVVILTFLNPDVLMVISLFPWKKNLALVTLYQNMHEGNVHLVVRLF